MTEKLLVMIPRLILFCLVVGLLCVSSAVAIDVPDGTFDEHDVSGGVRWAYVNDVAGHDWISENVGGGTPWIGNNYGNGYPVLGHSGAQFIDLNTAVIHQTLTGETYRAGTTYELSIWATTNSGGQELEIYFLNGNNWATPLASQSLAVAIEANLATWSQYSFKYTARAEDHGNLIGIGFWGGYNTWADSVNLVIDANTVGFPVVTSDMEDIVIDESRTAVFTVEHVNGTSYEWHKVGFGVVESGVTVSGEAITLTFSDVRVSDSGYYFCKIMNDKVPEGVDSDQVHLTVTGLTCGDWGYLRSDINRDCYVDMLDLVELAEKWLNVPME